MTWMAGEQSWGPSTTLKGYLRTEGRGRAWSRRLFRTSLYTAAKRPVAGAGNLMMERSPFATIADAISRSRNLRSFRGWCFEAYAIGGAGMEEDDGVA
ncbi:hypothetical protein RHGRI_009942 [Rhododendron griersonianum]|uniref:Uncharacterized protein n=1 Tax=Rhododendron griersonianum TaxID=479676 RepID=A0AAV6KGY9_9ERIC|nr:hypothetical protein RHGRI_009942 [Rhododendron griersonianum]